MLDDLEDQEAARQNWDAYHERLREAKKRGESAQTLARRYYLPLMAAAITLQKGEESANYNRLISQVRLSESQQLRWLRLRSRLEEAQGNIAQAIATAEERLELSKELDKERAQEDRKQQKQEPPRNTLSALNDLHLLHYRQKNFDEAERWLLQGLDTAPNHKAILDNYANFLTEVRQDHEKAEEFYRRAVEADPKDARIFSNYAVFLCLTRHDFEQAGIYFRRAMEAAPNDSQHVINYAAFLLIQGQKDEGKVMLDRAAAMPNLLDAQQVGIAFHLYIHFPEEVPSPLKELKRVLKSGKRAKRWMFDENIKRAQQDKHSNMALLKALAAVIREDKSLKSLDAFREWRMA